MSGTSAAVLTLSSLLTMGFTGVAHAAATYTCTWVGAGDGTSFSDGANWTGCNSAAPVPADTDTLVFDVSTFAADKTLNNDIASLAVTDVQFTGDNTTGNFPSLKLSGNPITVNGSVLDTSTGASSQFALDLILGADITLTDPLNVDSSTNSTQTINLNGHNLTVGAGAGLVANKITGNGNLTIATSSYAYLMKANTGWSGSVSVAATGSISVFPGSITSANSITVADTGNITLCALNGADVASPLTVGGTGAIYTAASCGLGGAGGSGLNPLASVNWTGPITLTKNTTVSGAGEFKVSGSLSGAYTLTQAAGTDGKVTIASSNNTSQTPNGTQSSTLKTTTYSDNQPTMALGVYSNNVAIVDGTYGNVDVGSGGILKGTGTVDMLSIAAGGIVAPGHSPGCLNTGDLIEGGTYQVEIGGTAACTGYDQIKVTGTVDVTDGIVETSLYNKYLPKQGEVYTIISNDGTDAVTGTFKNLPEGATFDQNGVTFKVSYVGGDGNDITLTVMNQPTAPDTGFALVAANPVASLGLMTAAAGAILFIARRSRFASATARKTTRRK